jgi:hypothetical protein
MYVQRNIEARSRIIVAVEKNNHYLLVCVCVCVYACVYQGAWGCAYAYVHVALLIQHAKSMRHGVTSFVTPPSLYYFSTSSHKRCEHKMRLDFLYKLCLKHCSFEEEFSDKWENVFM